MCHKDFLYRVVSKKPFVIINYKNITDLNKIIQMVDKIFQKTPLDVLLKIFDKHKILQH